MFDLTCMISSMDAISQKLTSIAFSYTNLSVIWTFNPLISLSDIVSINKLNSDSENYLSVLHQTHYDVTNRSNNVNYEGLNIHYHWYLSSSYWTCCDTSSNVCLDLHNYHYSIYLCMLVLLQIQWRVFYTGLFQEKIHEGGGGGSELRQ